MSYSVESTGRETAPRAKTEKRECWEWFLKGEYEFNL